MAHVIDHNTIGLPYATAGVTTTARGATKATATCPECGTVCVGRNGKDAGRAYAAHYTNAAEVEAAIAAGEAFTHEQAEDELRRHGYTVRDIVTSSHGGFPEWYRPETDDRGRLCWQPFSYETHAPEHSGVGRAFFLQQPHGRGDLLVLGERADSQPITPLRWMVTYPDGTAWDLPMTEGDARAMVAELAKHGHEATAEPFKVTA